MKKTKKIFLAVVLCALVVFSAIPASALVFDVPGYERNVHLAFVGWQGSPGRTFVASVRGNVYVGVPSTGSHKLTDTFLDIWIEDNGDKVAYSNNGEQFRFVTEKGIIFPGEARYYPYCIILADTLEIHNQNYFDIMFAIDPSDAYDQGYAAGEEVGYDQGFEAGASAEYSEGYQDAYDEYYPQIGAAYDKGFDEGKIEGIAEGIGLSETDFFDLCFAVAQAPLDVLYGVFDFEILGFNMQSAIGSLATVCIVVFLVKILLFFFG